MIVNAYISNSVSTTVVPGAGTNDTYGIALNDAGDLLYTEEEETKILSTGGSYSLGIPSGFARVEGRDINNSLQVVANASRSGFPGLGNTRAFFHDGTAWIDIAAENGFSDTDSIAIGMNNVGQVVGGTGIMSGSPPLTRAFIYSCEGVEFIELPTGFVAGFAMAINNLGEVTGMMWTAANERHSFLYADGLVTDLGPAFALAMNDNRQIVGTLNNRAVLYDPILGLQDLTLSLDADPGFILQSADGINNMGQIVGYSGIVPGFAANHAYVLSPSGTPQPTYNIGFSNPTRRAPESGGTWFVAFAVASIALARRATKPD